MTVLCKLWIFKGRNLCWGVAPWHLSFLQPPWLLPGFGGQGGLA